LTRWLAVVALLAGSRGIFTCVDRLVDLDAAVVEIERRRERWTALGFLVGPVTWRDEADSWPLTLWTDRALVVDPDSIGVGLERGDLTAANVTLFRGGWADVELFSPALDSVVIENPGVPDVAAFGLVLDDVLRASVGNELWLHDVRSAHTSPSAPT
jgi:hypothetical protein